MTNYSKYTTGTLEHWAEDRCGNCKKWNNPAWCPRVTETEYVGIHDTICDKYEVDTITKGVQKELTRRRITE